MSPDAAQLVVSSSAERRHKAAREWLRGLPAGSSFLLLAPSRGAADDFLRRSAAETGGVLGAHRFTLAQFAWLAASRELGARGVARLGDLGGEAMATLSTARALERGDLAQLVGVATMPGFARALASTLRELRLAGVDPADLATLDGAGADLATLLRGYRAELDLSGLADPARILELATESLAASDPRSGAVAEWRGMPTLWLDLRIWAPLERRLLAALHAAAGPTLLTVAKGDGETLAAGRSIFGGGTIDLGSTVPETLDLDPPPAATVAEAGDANTALERAQRYVFEPEIPEPPARVASPVSAEPSTNRASPKDPSLDLFSASGEGQECVEIARRIRDLAADGARFDDLAIFVRQPYDYMPLIEDALRRAKIPAFFSHGTTRPDPAGRAFLALLQCAAERLSASRFAEYLSLSQVPGLDAGAKPRAREVPWIEPVGEQLVLRTLEEVGEAVSSGGPAPTATPAGAEAAPDDDAALADETALEAEEEGGPVLAGALPTPAYWERLLVDAAVVGGADRWRRRLAGLDAELRRRIREVGDEEEPRRRGLERTLERLGHLRGFALPLIERLAELPESATWGEWLGRLETLAVQSLRQPQSVLRLLAELRPLAEVGPVRLEQVQQVLGERLSLLRTEPPRRRYGRVFVGSLGEAAGRSFDVVFVPGLAEGVFPRRSGEDPLLLDELRDRLGAGLVGQEQRVQRERLLLHLALGAARSRVVVSYPRVDVVRGRARVPSFYALDLLRAAEGRVPDLKSLAQRAGSLGVAPAGWQVPAERDHAIDDREYDLALLRDLLRLPAGSGRGEGRFLLTVNPHLERSLRARWLRWHRPWTYADGLVLEDVGTDGAAGVGGATSSANSAGDSRTLLAAHGPQKRSFSPTALQHFAACPYRFFLQAIMRLRPREDHAGLEQLDPLTRGSMFHEMQFALQVELRDAGLLPVTQDNLDRVLEAADAVFDRSEERFAEELAPAIPRVWTSELENLRNDLRGWLRHISELGGGWRPLHFELAFGIEAGADRDPASVAAPVELEGERLVRGAIDLVEVTGEALGGASGGTGDGRSALRVTDHKTGRARGKKGLVISGGQVLQPLIYALAAERMVAEGRPVVAGRLFYCTQRGEFSEVEVPLDEGSRRAVGQVFAEVEQSIARGFLPAAPAHEACQWCDYRAVCGPNEEVRASRKDQGRLESLQGLRRHR